MPALIASYTSAAGGAERLLLDVASCLDEPPMVACPPGWLADEARARDLRVFELRERSLHVRRSLRDRIASVPRVAAHARELRRLYAALRPEVVVAWGMRTALATAAALQRIDNPPRWIFEHVDFLPGAAVARAGFGVILWHGWTLLLAFIVLSPLIGFVLGAPAQSL